MIDAGLFTLGQLAEAVSGDLVGSPSLGVSGVNIDSRVVEPGDLFVALEGQRTDGHAYVQQAFDRGAVAVMVRRGKGLPGAGPYVEVDDPLSALGLAGSWYLRHFDIPVIAVTGSVGKTTCKDMIAAVLATRMQVLKTPGNLNTDIGTPLTLFQLRSHHEVAVLELGMRKPGDLRYLANLLCPDVGVLTNVRESHLEYFGSQERIALAKAELMEALSPSGWAVVNADDPWGVWMEDRTRARVLRYSMEDVHADVYAQDIVLDERVRPSFVLKMAKSESQSVKLPISGRHHVSNALAAAACGHIFGVDARQIAQGLARFVPTGMRTEWTHNGDISIIDDAYNSSPTSCRAALDMLSKVRTGGRKVAILGPMLELGEDEARVHHALGQDLTEWGIDCLWTVGPLAEVIQQGALAAGFPPQHARYFDDVEAVLGSLVEGLQPEDVVLVKASRSCRFERIVDALKALPYLPPKGESGDG